MPRKAKKTASAKVTLTLVVGKGVLAKDNKTPYAARTLHVTREAQTDLGPRDFMSPVDYTMANIINALFDPNVKRLQLIDAYNDQFTIEITR